MTKLEHTGNRSVARVQDIIRPDKWDAIRGFFPLTLWTARTRDAELVE